MNFRTGRHNNRTVYFQSGKEPGDNDQFVCVAMTRDGAVTIAAALNEMFKNDLWSDVNSKWALAGLISIDASS